MSFLLLLSLAFSAPQCPRMIGIAWSIGTGLRHERLQGCIHAVERKAKKNVSLSQNDIAFLRRLYRTFSVGARVTFIARQTGRMMKRYLRGSGKDFKLMPRIFKRSHRIQEQMERLRKKVSTDGCLKTKEYSLPPARMAPSKKYHYDLYRESRTKGIYELLLAVDSFVGLYYTGHIEVTAQPVRPGVCRLTWHAELPWKWPTYEQLYAKKGYSYGEPFHFPNMRSILTQDKKYEIKLDNALGGELEQIGEAKSFTAYAEWTERYSL